MSLLGFERLKMQFDRNEPQFPPRLQMYKIPPTDRISLETFETMAIERLKRELCISGIIHFFDCSCQCINIYIYIYIVA